MCCLAGSFCFEVGEKFEEEIFKDFRQHRGNRGKNMKKGVRNVGDHW
jgi:hypothetical protein